MLPMSPNISFWKTVIQNYNIRDFPVHRKLHSWSQAKKVKREKQFIALKPKTFNVSPFYHRMWEQQNFLSYSHLTTKHSTAPQSRFSTAITVKIFVLWLYACMTVQWRETKWTMLFFSEWEECHTSQPEFTPDLSHSILMLDNGLSNI